MSDDNMVWRDVCPTCFATTRAEAEEKCQSKLAPCPGDSMVFPDDKPSAPVESTAISARDLFAAAALASGRLDVDYPEAVARIAFQIADAMMEARMKK